MAIVVDDQFLSEFLGLNHKSGWAKGAETNDGSDFPVRRDQNGSKIAAVSGKRIQGARPASVAAGNDAARRYPSCVQELSAIHDILRNKTGRRWSCGELYSRYRVKSLRRSLPRSSIVNYGVDDGLPDRVVSDFVATQSGGAYWIATPRGTATKSLKFQKNSSQLLQGRVFILGLAEDRDVGLGVFPESEEIVVGSAGFANITFHGIGPADLKTH